MSKSKSNVLFFSIILLAASFQVYAKGAKRPIVKKDPPPVKVELPTNEGPYISHILDLANNSKCITNDWAGRGRAPAGYIKGVALSYARSLCRLKNHSSLSSILGSASSGNAKKDALAYYQSTFDTLPILLTKSGPEPLRAIYTLGIGLGMRESSGQYCEGWDKAAGSNRPSSAAEAGAFQTSYDSMVLSPELAKLYEEYKSKPEKCMLDIFKQGVNCKTLNILGTGEGAVYQAFNISCPAFATEYAMTMLRIQRTHYGPINRKDAQVVPACNVLLKSIESFIDNDQYSCSDIYK